MKRGAYNFIKKIAEGGVADIYLAKAKTDAGHDKYLVCKCVKAAYAHDHEFLTSIINEVQFSNRLHHPNIIEIFDLCLCDGNTFLTMEYLDAHNFHHLLQKNAELWDRVPYNLAIYAICQAANGLHAAHQMTDEAGNLLHLVHRDISPENILFGSNGDIKISDFGIAKTCRMPNITPPDTIKGKFNYMSPEQAWGDKADLRSDIYSLAIVLYEALLGQRFNPAETIDDAISFARMAFFELPHTLDPDFPLDLEKVLLKALDLDKKKRYQTALEFKKALDECAIAHNWSASRDDWINYLKSHTDFPEPPLPLLTAGELSPDETSILKPHNQKVEDNTTSDFDTTGQVSTDMLIQMLNKMDAMSGSIAVQLDSRAVDSSRTSLISQPPMFKAGAAIADEGINPGEKTILSQMPSLESIIQNAESAPQKNEKPSVPGSDTPSRRIPKIVRSSAQNAGDSIVTKASSGSQSGPIPVVHTGSQSGPIPVVHTGSQSGPIPVVHTGSQSGPIPVVHTGSQSGPIPAINAESQSEQTSAVKPEEKSAAKNESTAGKQPANNGSISRRLPVINAGSQSKQLAAIQAESSPQNAIKRPKTVLNKTEAIAAPFIANLPKADSKDENSQNNASPAEKPGVSAFKEKETVVAAPPVDVSAELMSSVETQAIAAPNMEMLMAAEIAKKSADEQNAASADANGEKIPEIAPQDSEKTKVVADSLDNTTKNPPIKDDDAETAAKPKRKVKKPNIVKSKKPIDRTVALVAPDMSFLEKAKKAQEAKQKELEQQNNQDNLDDDDDDILTRSGYNHTVPMCDSVQMPVLDEADLAKPLFDNDGKPIPAYENNGLTIPEIDSVPTTDPVPSSDHTVPMIPSVPVADPVPSSDYTIPVKAPVIPGNPINSSDLTIPEIPTFKDQKKDGESEGEGEDVEGRVTIPKSDNTSVFKAVAPKKSNSIRNLLIVAIILVFIIALGIGLLIFFNIDIHPYLNMLFKS